MIRRPPRSPLFPSPTLSRSQYGGPDRTDRGNLAEPFPGLVFLALRQQLPPHFLTHHPQRIELLIVKLRPPADRKSTRLNSSHGYISYAVFCLKKKKKTTQHSDQSITEHDSLPNTQRPDNSTTRRRSAVPIDGHPGRCTRRCAILTPRTNSRYT